MIWKLVMPITNDARRGTAPDLSQDIDRICIIGRPIPTSPPAVQSPAMMASVTNVVNPGRCVPWEKVVALHVAVVSEHIAKTVKVKIVRVAKAVRDRLHLAALRRKTDESACFNIANRWRRRGDKLRPKPCIISTNQIKPS